MCLNKGTGHNEEILNQTIQVALRRSVPTYANLQVHQLGSR